MKCSELVLKGTRILKEKGIEASRLEAEVLLAFAWRWDRTHLLIFFDEPVPGDVEKRYDDLICSPAVTWSGTLSERGRISVNGPGRNLSASSSAAGGQKEANSLAWSSEETCRIRGFSCGLPLT
jgi:hypothetical protein